MEENIYEEKVDELGRIVINLLLQEKIGINKESYVGIILKGKKIIIKKLNDSIIKKIKEQKAKNKQDYIIYVQNEKNITVRAIDELARLVIPIQLREKLDIKERDKLIEYIEDKEIVLEKV